MILYENKLKGI